MKTVLRTNRNACFASIKQIPVSHKKMYALMSLIRGMSAENARLQLAFSKKDGAKYLHGLVSSCIANGVYKGLDPRKLMITLSTVSQGEMYRRFMPRGRGRSTRIEKRTSSIFVAMSEVSVDSAEKAEKIKVDTREKSLSEKKSTTKRGAVASMLGSIKRNLKGK